MSTAEQSKLYYQANREKIIARNMAYVEKNKEKTSIYQKDWRAKNWPLIKEHHFADVKARLASYLSEWSEIIPKVTNCQICGLKIFFASGNAKNSIHFDHRHGGVEPIKRPMAFLRTNRRTPQSEALWKSCDFGMLCLKCNQNLPTSGRMDYLTKAIKYAEQAQREG